MNKLRIDATRRQANARGLAINQRFVGQIVRSEGLGRTNIVQGQTRMICNDLLWRITRSQLAQYDLDRNTRTSDNRFPAHHFRIDLNSFMRHWTSCAWRRLHLLLAHLRPWQNQFGAQPADRRGGEREPPAVERRKLHHD